MSLGHPSIFAALDLFAVAAGNDSQMLPTTEQTPLQPQPGSSNSHNSCRMRNMTAELVIKLARLEKLSFLPGLVTQNSLSGLAAQVNEVLSRTLAYRAKEEKVGYWKLIFLQSKVNGCSYRGDALPHAKWQWPKDTWFQGKMGSRRKSLELAGHLSRN